MSWHINPQGNYVHRLFEFYSRLAGRFGGFVPPGTKADLVAFPWQGFENSFLQVLEERRIRAIAGSADTEEAVAKVVNSAAIGAFTDHPHLFLSQTTRPSSVSEE